MVLFDASTARAAQQEHAHSLPAFRVLVDALSDGVVLLDHNGRTLMLNANAAHLLKSISDQRGNLISALGLEPIFHCVTAFSRPMQTLFSMPGPPRQVLRLALNMVELNPGDPFWLLTMRDVTLEQALLGSLPEQVKELEALHELSRRLVASTSRQAVADTLVQCAVSTLGFTFCKLVVPSRGGFSCLAFSTIRPLDSPRMANGPEPRETWPFYRRVLDQAAALPVTSGDSSLDPLELAALLPRNISFIVATPIFTRNCPMGILVLGDARKPRRHPLNLHTRNLIDTVVNQAATAFQRVELHEDLERAYLQTVLALARAMDARDTYTANHSQFLAHWAEIIATQLELPQEEILAIRWGALLHDIGKIGVPDSILLKESPLDAQEWHTMKQHPVIGADIVSSTSCLAHAAPIIRHHHEKYDGTGYPDGLSAEDIPLGSRIVAVVDSFSAMTDKRTYRGASSPEDSLKELQRCSGSHFDPHIVSVFMSVLKNPDYQPSQRTVARTSAA